MPDAGGVHEVKATLFRVVGHPARVRILELLRDGERSVGTLQAELGLDSGGTSQHLSALRRIGLVESRRDGTSVYYRVDDERRVFDLLAAGRDIVGRQLSKQQAMLLEPGRVTGALLLAGLAALALGGLLAAPRRTFQTGLTVQACGAAAVCVAGFLVLATGSTLGQGFTSEFTPRFGVDGLSGLFLGALGLVAAAALVFSATTSRQTGAGGRSRCSAALLVLVLAGVFCAREIR